MALLDPQDKTVVSGIGALCSTHRQPNTSISLGGLKTGDRAFSRSLSFAWSAFGDFQRERFSRRRTDLVVRPHQGRPFFRSKSPRVVFFFRGTTSGNFRSSFHEKKSGFSVCVWFWHQEGDLVWIFLQCFACFVRIIFTSVYLIGKREYFHCKTNYKISPNYGTV